MHISSFRQRFSEMNNDAPSQLLWPLRFSWLARLGACGLYEREKLASRIQDKIIPKNLVIPSLKDPERKAATPAEKHELKTLD